MNSGGAENKTALAIRDVIAAVNISLALTVIAALLAGGGGHGSHVTHAKPERHDERGFTLIEISIVLVIIGLIVGGVLVGQDLIHAANVRATITQIEKYNQAANTFYGKYGYLPGDINATAAAQFGFTPRGPYAGQGDGNGLLEGNDLNASNGNRGYFQSAGETIMFWVDLTSANGQNVNLIEGGFSSASPTVVVNATGTALASYLPAAKIGRGNYFYAYGVGQTMGSSGNFYYGQNYFGLAAVSQIGNPVGGIASSPALTVKEAYDIDTKIDDGFPQSGRVIATFTDASGIEWAAGGGSYGASSGGIPTTAATSGSSTTCYDNGNAAGASQQYSVEQNNGAGVNCALSFRMQAGD